jgi:hypothetical protein
MWQALSGASGDSRLGGRQSRRLGTKVTIDAVSAGEDQILMTRNLRRRASIRPDIAVPLDRAPV